MINPFERFYDTALEVYSQKKGGYSGGDTKTLLGTVICDLQPLSDEAKSKLFGLSEDRGYKLFSDTTPLLRNGNLILFGAAWYRIIKTEEWSFGMTAVIRSVGNES